MYSVDREPAHDSITTETRKCPLIIRRIVENFRIQNWSVVAIELFVVVVGVFLGIQVSNWNDARIDQGRAQSYLERIRIDLDMDVAAYSDRLEFWDQVSAYGALGLRYAETGNSAKHAPWKLLLAYFQASQLAEFFTTDATYAELKSGGDLSLIKDLDLRNQLANYYTNADNPVLSERPVYREHVRGLIPLNIQNYIWENCYKSTDLGAQLMLECEAPADVGDIAQLVAMISDQEQLMSDLRYWMSTMHVANIMGVNRIGFARKLRDLIDRQISDEST